jgi:hypothetical protein
VDTPISLIEIILFHDTVEMASGLKGVEEKEKY